MSSPFSMVSSVSASLFCTFSSVLISPQRLTQIFPSMFLAVFFFFCTLLDLNGAQQPQCESPLASTISMSPCILSFILGIWALSSKRSSITSSWMLFQWSSEVTSFPFSMLFVLSAFRLWKPCSRCTYSWFVYVMLAGWKLDKPLCLELK